LKNYYQIAKYGGDQIDRQPKHVSSKMHPAYNSHVQAANRPLHINEANYTSVSRESPPAFLTQMPLGAPHQGTVDNRYSPELPPSLPVNRRVIERPRQVQAKGQAAVMHLNDAGVVDQANWSNGTQKRAVKDGFMHRWVYEEVRLSMSKMSIMSLVLGLLFLGVLFFIIGFLAAVATLKSQESAHNSQSAWQSSNTPSHGEQSQGGGRLGKIGTNVAGGMAAGVIHKELQPLGKILGKATSVVPAPLQPFARYGIGSTTAHVRSAGRAVSPFAHHNRGPAEQQTYPSSQQQMPMQQQYGQPYPNQMAYPVSTGGYQQSAGMQQNAPGYYGNGMYGQGMAMQQPMQQQYNQQPMQQPMQQQYYQQPMQQQAMPQQNMMPAQPMMPAQNQMMQAPGYSQQMMPQQNYYR
jgi:hypothetical protein